jgi:hypothetical protein
MSLNDGLIPSLTIFHDTIYGFVKNYDYKSYLLDTFRHFLVDFLLAQVRWSLLFLVMWLVGSFYQGKEKRQLCHFLVT